ncbi:MAG TPA: hypothetical protein VK399_01430 [Longimicrobiaceae bacterium]|nr:hypothetical protein [Longimicrobiaceae bacterium]
MSRDDKLRLISLLERLLGDSPDGRSLTERDRADIARILMTLRTAEPGPAEVRSSGLGKVIGVLFVISFVLALVVAPAIVAVLTHSVTLTSIMAVVWTFTLVIFAGSLMGKVSWGMAVIALLILIVFYGLVTASYFAS